SKRGVGKSSSLGGAWNRSPARRLFASPFVHSTTAGTGSFLKETEPFRHNRTCEADTSSTVSVHSRERTAFGSQVTPLVSERSRSAERATRSPKAAGNRSCSPFLRPAGTSDLHSASVSHTVSRPGS